MVFYFQEWSGLNCYGILIKKQIKGKRCLANGVLDVTMIYLQLNNLKKHHMKRLIKINMISIFVILIFTLNTQLIYCQVSSNPIGLTVLNKKALYHKRDTLKFKFQNLSGRKLWIIVGFEVLSEGNWIEVFYDLDYPLSGVGKIYSIEKQRYLNLLVKNVPFTGPKSPPYRLFINYSENHKLSNPKKQILQEFVFFQ